MSQALILHTEPLTPGELNFLVAKELSERKMYYKVFRMLMVGSFIIPFITAWYRVTDNSPNAFSYVKFFATAATLLSISGIATYMSYRLYLRNVQKDIKYKTKTIETNRITKKVYVQVNNTYHLYINSSAQLSIEVTQEDFIRYEDGDEVSIEYSTYAKEYLGYF